MEAPITYEIIVSDELFQIEDVPALVCRNCGEQWIDDEVKRNIEEMVTETNHNQPNVH